MNQDHETCPMCGADDYETHRPHWADGVAPFKPFCECRCGATWDEDRPIKQCPPCTQDCNQGRNCPATKKGQP